MVLNTHGLILFLPKIMVEWNNLIACPGKWVICPIIRGPFFFYWSWESESKAPSGFANTECLPACSRSWFASIPWHFKPCLGRVLENTSFQKKCLLFVKRTISSTTWDNIYIYYINIQCNSFRLLTVKTRWSTTTNGMTFWFVWSAFRSNKLISNKCHKDFW